MKNNITISLDRPVTCFMLVAPIGARYEDNKVKGISHFVEHMMFKGTKKLNSNQLSKVFGQYGANINAYTSWEQTCYHVTVANKYKNPCRKLLIEMFNTPIFSTKEIDKERQVIIQELNMYNDNPGEMLEREFNTRLFYKSSGFYLYILGTKKTLKNIGRKELLNFYNKHYKKPLLIEVGNVKSKTIKKLNKIKNNNYEMIKEKNYGHPISYNYGLNQTKMQIGDCFFEESMSSEDLIVLSDILEACYNGMGGRLFKTIREKYNMVYGIRSNFNVYGNNHLFWTIGLGLNQKNKLKAYRLILNELKKPITKSEMKYIKTKINGKKALLLNSLYSIADSTADLYTLGIDPIKFLRDYNQRLNKILKNINEYRNQIYNFDKHVAVDIY